MERIKLMDERVIVDNRDSDTTELHVLGETLYVERGKLEKMYRMSDVGHVLRGDNVEIPLSDGDIRYLLENFEENNPED